VTPRRTEEGRGGEVGVKGGGREVGGKKKY
jgi:hypothetical protein